MEKVFSRCPEESHSKDNEVNSEADEELFPVGRGPPSKPDPEEDEGHHNRGINVEVALSAVIVSLVFKHLNAIMTVSGQLPWPPNESYELLVRQLPHLRNQRFGHVQVVV